MRSKQIWIKALAAIVLAYQLLASFVNVPVAEASASNPNALNVSMDVPTEAVLGVPTTVTIRLQQALGNASTPSDWDYNVGIELTLPNGLQLASSQSTSATSTVTNADGTQTLFWRDLKDMSPGETYEFDVDVEVLDKYRAPNATTDVPFGTALALSVKAYTSSDARIVCDSTMTGMTGNAACQTVTPTPPAGQWKVKVVPFQIKFHDIAKEVKGAGTNFSDQTGEWGGYEYAFDIINNTRYKTHFNSLSSDVNGDLDLYGFRIDGATVTPTITVGANKHTIGWAAFDVIAGGTKTVLFNAAFFNRTMTGASNATINQGTVIHHGDSITNTLTYNAQLKNSSDGDVGSPYTPSAPIEYDGKAHDIIISKSADKSAFDAAKNIGYGETVAYTLVVKTNEYYGVDDVTVDDIIEDGQTFGSVLSVEDGNGQTVTPLSFNADTTTRTTDGTTKLHWDLGDLPHTHTVTIKYTTTVDDHWSFKNGHSPIYAGDTLSNKATVTGTTYESDSSTAYTATVTDSDSESLRIKTPDISEKIVVVNGTTVDARTASVTAGDTITFAVYYDNANLNAKQHGVVFFDYLPEGTELLDGNNNPVSDNTPVPASEFVFNTNVHVIPVYKAGSHMLVWDMSDINGDGMPNAAIDINENPSLTLAAPAIVKVRAMNSVKVQKTKSDQNLVNLSYANSDSIVASNRDSVKVSYVEPQLTLQRFVNPMANPSPVPSGDGTSVYPSGSVTVAGGQKVKVTVKLKNAGTTAAYNVKLHELIPDELDPATVTWVDGPTFPAPGGDKTIHYTLPSGGEIAPNDTIVFIYTADVKTTVGAKKDIKQQSDWEYDSQPSAAAGENRHYDKNANPNTTIVPVENAHVTMVTETVKITKRVVESGFAGGTPVAGTTDIHIGDWVVYEVKVEVPKNEIAFDPQMIDTLPAYHSLQAVMSDYSNVSHTGTTVTAGTYIYNSGAGTVTIADINGNSNNGLFYDAAASVTYNTYLYYIKSQVTAVSAGADINTGETQRSSATFKWNDTASGNSTRNKSETSNQPSITVKWPNLVSTMMPATADMDLETNKTKVFTYTITNAGQNTAYDFVPTITLPPGFKPVGLNDNGVGTYDDQTLPTPASITGNIDNGFTLTYPLVPTLAKSGTLPYAVNTELVKVKGSGSTHQVSGSSGPYYSSHEAYAASAAGAVNELTKYTATTNHSDVTVPSVRLTNDIISNSNGNSTANIRPGDTIDYKLVMTVPSGTIAYSPFVTDTFSKLAKFDVLSVDPDGGNVSVTGSTYKISYLDIDASSSEQTKTIVFHLRAKSNGGFIDATESGGAGTSATATWLTAPSDGTTKSTQPATNNIAVLRPIVAIIAAPSVTDPQFKAGNNEITVSYTLTNSGASAAYSSKVTVPVLAGMSVKPDSIQVTGGGTGSGTESGGVVTFDNVTVPAGGSAVLSFVVMLSPGSPLIGASVGNLDVEATLIHYSSIDNPGGEIYAPASKAKHTLDVKAAALTATITGNTLAAGNTTSVRPGDRLTYNVVVSLPDNSVAYTPILKNTGLTGQHIVSVTLGGTPIGETSGIGYELPASVIGTAAGTSLTVVTEIETTVNGLTQAKFEPQLAYKTAAISGTNQTATAAPLSLTVIEPNLSVTITEDKTELATPGETVQYTVRVSNATGTSTAYNAKLALSVADVVYLTSIDRPATGDSDSVTGTTGTDSDGTIAWTIGRIPASGYAELVFYAAARNATVAQTGVYGEATLQEYYSLPADILAHDGGKKYMPLQTDTATGTVIGQHALTTTSPLTVTAGIYTSFSHVLSNIGAGRDSFELNLANGIYPTELYTGTQLIASGSLVEGEWVWNIESGFNVGGKIVVSLDAGESMPLRLYVKVPVSTQYDDIAHTTTLSAKSVIYGGAHTEVADDVLTVTGIPLDGWAGSAARTGNQAPHPNIWVMPVFGKYDSMDIQAVSAVNVQKVKAEYTVSAATYEIYLTSTNDDYVHDGYRVWKGVSRLPFTVNAGIYGIQFTAYDANDIALQPANINADAASDALSRGDNNMFKIRQELRVEGTITDAKTGDVIPGSTVKLYDPLNGSEDAETDTDVNGYYYFDNVMVKEYELHVTKPDYSQSTQRFYAIPADDSASNVIVDAQLSPSRYFITLKANPTTILGDGLSTTLLTAVITDSAGRKLANVPATFTTGRGTFPNNTTTTQVTTGPDGTAQVLLKSEVITGTASVRFPIDIDVADATHDLYAHGQIVMTFDPGAIVGIVTKPKKLADGSYTTEVVPGATVKVTKKEGNTIIFAAEMKTDADGKYQIAIPIGNTDYDVVVTYPVEVGGNTVDVSFPQVAHAGAINASGYEKYPAEKTGSGMLLINSQNGDTEILPSTLINSIRGYLIDSLGNKTPIAINADGTFNQQGILPGTYQLAIAYSDGTNELIMGGNMPTVVIGNNAVDGEMNIAIGLIDPYGKVTDSSNGQPLENVKVDLYYADTPYNRATVVANTPVNGLGHELPVPNTPVHLPAIVGFAPNDNMSPQQLTSLLGDYAYMVYGNTDYYLVFSLPGYYTKTSPTIEVRAAIVMYNTALDPIPAPTGGGGGGGTPVVTPPVTQPTATQPPTAVDKNEIDLAVNVLSDRASYPEGATITFTLEYINRSDKAAKDVALQASIPDYTEITDAAGGTVDGSTIRWTLGEIAGKASGKVTYKVKVKDKSLAQAETLVHNDVAITSSDKLVNVQDDKSSIQVLLFTDRFGAQMHKRYIMGYPDGLFKPDRAITRAEIAAIFARIMDLRSTVTHEKMYKDVEPTFWAGEYIEAATRAGLFGGYEDGTFLPDKAISRAELSVVIARYLKLTDRVPMQVHFSDLGSHWATNYIEEIYRNHIIDGYPDGTFKPGASMIRTEAVTMINRLLHRGPLNDSDVMFPDMTPDHWAFGQVQESALTHEYTRNLDGSEHMTKYIPEDLW